MATEKIELSLTTQYLYRETKEVTESVFSIIDSQTPQLSGFSGVGSYNIQMWRMGCTTHIKF